jgi:hypothetical protein
VLKILGIQRCAASIQCRGKDQTVPNGKAISLTDALRLKKCLIGDCAGIRAHHGCPKNHPLHLTPIHFEFGARDGSQFVQNLNADYAPEKQYALGGYGFIAGGRECVQHNIRI